MRMTEDGTGRGDGTDMYAYMYTPKPFTFAIDHGTKQDPVRSVVLNPHVQVRLGG